MKNIINLIVSVVLFLFVLDLYIFGGERVIDFAGVTLRMILFVAILAFAIAVTILKRKIHSLTLYVILLSTLILVIGILISTVTISGSPDNAVSVSAYFFVFLCLAFSCFPDRIFWFIDNGIRPSAVFLSMSYLIFLYAIYVGYISILDIYRYIPESEVFLRGESALVYKGFIFVLIGILHFLIVDSKYTLLKYIFLFFCITAVLATLTRGFIVSLIFVTFIYFFFNVKSVLVKVLISIAVILLPFVLYMFFSQELSRAGSDEVRLNDINMFVDYISSDVVRLFFGGGVSAFLGERAAIENAYMDTILRFGLFGLFFVFFVFFLIWKKFNKIMLLTNPNVDKEKCKWLFYSVLLIYIQSNFNPYINNYIGGTFVVFVLLYFDFLLRERKL